MYLFLGETDLLYIGEIRDLHLLLFTHTTIKVVLYTIDFDISEVK